MQSKEWFDYKNRGYGDWLAHHGIKGQQWGVRRFQNEDGSLTEEGLARYGKLPRNGLSDREKAMHNKKIDTLNKALWLNQERKDLAAILLSEAHTSEDARIARERVSAWKKREKKLLALDINNISEDELRKKTKLKWHEIYYPDEW